MLYVQTRSISSARDERASLSFSAKIKKELVHILFLILTDRAHNDLCAREGTWQE